MSSAPFRPDAAGLKSGRMSMSKSTGKLHPPNKTTAAAKEIPASYRPNEVHRFSYILKPTSPFAPLVPPPVQTCPSPEDVHPQFPSSALRCLAPDDPLLNTHPKLLENPLMLETLKRLKEPPQPKAPRVYLDAVIPATATHISLSSVLASTLVSSSSDPPSDTATPLEKVLAQCLVLRETYLSRLRSLLCTKRAERLLVLPAARGEAGGGVPLSEEVVLLLTEVSDLLSLIRHSTVELLEKLGEWRKIHGSLLSPFSTPEGGRPYLSTIASSLDYLEGYPLLVKWVGAPLRRNPLVLKNNLDARLEGIRSFEGLPPIMKDNPFEDAYRDLESTYASSSKHFVLPDSSSDAAANSENAENYTAADVSTDDIVPAHNAPKAQAANTTSVTVALAAGKSSLDPTDPRNVASRALYAAQLALSPSSSSSSSLSGLPTAAHSSLQSTPQFYANAVSTSRAAASSRRLLASERLLLHEEGLFSRRPLPELLSQLPSLTPHSEKDKKKVDESKGGKWDKGKGLATPTCVAEDEVVRKVMALSKDLASIKARVSNLSAQARERAKVLPSLRLQLWWARRVVKALEEQEEGTGEGDHEQLPWARGDYGGPEFDRAWNESSEFRRQLEFKEVLRFERMTFVFGIEHAKKAVEDAETDIATLQGLIADSFVKIEDHNIKIDTLRYRKNVAIGEFNNLVEARKARNKGKDDDWIKTKRSLLPVSVEAIESDKKWELAMRKEKHETMWWLSDYTRPEGGSLDLSHVPRKYPKPWKVRKLGVSVPDDYISSEEEEEEEGKDGAPDNTPDHVRTTGKSANKYASYCVFKGAFKISSIYCLITIIKKPPKGYIPAGIIVTCFCTSNKSKLSAKVTDVPDIVSSMFGGDTLKEFIANYPELAALSEEVPSSNVEREIWRKWCQHLRLARAVIAATERASGRVKLMWSVDPLPGEVCHEILHENDPEKDEVKNPVGCLWKGAVRLNVLSLEHLMGQAPPGAAPLPPSRFLNYIGREYYMAKVLGYKGTGYELSGVTVELFDSRTCKRSKNTMPISWNWFYENGWGTKGSKNGRKYPEDLKAFLENCFVLRHIHNVDGFEEVIFHTKERTDECVNMYEGDAIIDGRNAVVKIRGNSDYGILGDGRGRGLCLTATFVWEKELKTLNLNIGFKDLRESGYKGQWNLEDDGGIKYQMELRHIKRLLRNVVVCYANGVKTEVSLDWCRGRPTIFKMMGYVGGRFSCVSVRFARGTLIFTALDVTSAETAEIEVTEAALIDKGWVELSRQVANSNPEGLTAIAEKVLEWSAGGTLHLKECEMGWGCHAQVVLWKTSALIRGKMYFVKISTYTTGLFSGSKEGDSGIVFDLTPWDVDGGEHSIIRATMSREDLINHGVVLLTKGVIGKSLKPLPNHTLRMLLQKMRAELE